YARLQLYVLRKTIIPERRPRPIGIIVMHRVTVAEWQKIIEPQCRIVRNVLEYPLHHHIVLVVDADGLTHWVLLTEKRFRHMPGQHDGIGFRQRRLCISLQQGIWEHLQKIAAGTHSLE